MTEASAEPNTAGRIVVVGSVHLDMQIDVPRLPEPGETVLGTRYRRTPGGKGANQAVAAAIAGAAVTLIGRVGNDPDGVMVKSEVAARGVDVGYVSVDQHEPTGVALIVVDESGANQIAVGTGASGRLSPGEVARAADVIAAASVLLLQQEVPIETVQAASELVAEGTVVVLNPAPARDLPRELLQRADVLVPNLVELRQLSGEEDLASLDSIARAARKLPEGPAVVVTLGANGALIVDGESTSHVRGVPVHTVDTTGAGDAFCGMLASALAAGSSLAVAVKVANEFAASSTTRHGALNSYVATAGD